MKKPFSSVQKCIFVWACLLALLTLGSFDKGTIGYSGGEWFMTWGVPDWLNNGGYHGGYPGFWIGLTRGDWSWSIPGFLMGATVAWFPIALWLGFYSLIKKRLRFHLSTAIVILLEASLLIAANFSAVGRHGWDAWGWPLNKNNSPYQNIALITDISVATSIIFFTLLLSEWVICRYRSKSTGSPNS